MRNLKINMNCEKHLNAKMQNDLVTGVTNCEVCESIENTKWLLSCDMKRLEELAGRQALLTELFSYFGKDNK